VGFEPLAKPRSRFADKCGSGARSVAKPRAAEGAAKLVPCRAWNALPISAPMNACASLPPKLTPIGCTRRPGRPGRRSCRWLARGSARAMRRRIRRRLR